LLFRTVPSANTLIRWVDENAFASIVQARPCPTFGRPVHQRGGPLDYGPVLLLMPFGFHLTADTLPSGVLQESGFRSALAVSGFRLRARLGFSIPAFSLRPARHYPRLQIRRPSSGRRRDFNPPEQRAAQRTLCPPPTSRDAAAEFRLAPYIRCPSEALHLFASWDLPRYCTDIPNMPPLKRRGVKVWHRFHFQALCCLRACTTRSTLPSTGSPMNIRQSCMTALDSRSLSVTACRFVRWPGMGTGHAMSDMLHDSRLRRYHLPQTT
jgi:hypothetical protein